MPACRIWIWNWFNRDGVFTQAMKITFFFPILYYCYSQFSILHSFFMHEDVLCGCWHQLHQKTACIEFYGAMSMSWKNNISLISLVSHVWDHLAHKVESNMIKKPKCIWCVWNSPENVYLPALYICGIVWYEKIYIYIYAWRLDRFLHAFLSCDHWFVNHFVICSLREKKAIKTYLTLCEKKSNCPLC